MMVQRSYWNNIKEMFEKHQELNWYGKDCDNEQCEETLISGEH